MPRLLAEALRIDTVVWAGADPAMPDFDRQLVTMIQDMVTFGARSAEDQSGRGSAIDVHRLDFYA